MIDLLLQYIPAHEAQLVVLFSSFLSFLSLLFAFFTRTTALSKIIGTISIADLGRVVRYGIKFLQWFSAWRQARKVVNGALLVCIVLILPGCAAWPWSKTAWDYWRQACGKELASRGDVQASAAARKLDVEDFATALCELSDVVAPFIPKTTGARSLTPPGDQAVEAARQLGAMP